MTEKERNDYFYVCSLIEYIARQTKNRRGVIAEILGEKGIEKQFSFLDIGKLYCIMIENCAEQGKEMDELLKIFSSFISDKISDFQTDIYYQNPDYLECSYEAGYLLD
ncbi:MAG: hypothetical protein NC548_57640 [Lachnospiraceae bacterium]|nr:hypothetical protein [Lachnospiraceae bacterium]